jgi:hypothetical protein
MHSFKTLCEYAGLAWMGVVQASASAKGEIAGDRAAREAARALGRSCVL